VLSSLHEMLSFDLIELSVAARNCHEQDHVAALEEGHEPTLFVAEVSTP
jgi:hypothetical protein